MHAGRGHTRDAAHAVSGSQRALVSSARRALRSGAVALDGVDARLRALDPHRVLERGYTITRDEQGTLVRAAAAVPDGGVLVTETADGRLRSRVEER